MPQPIHIEAIERILSAVYPSGDCLLSSFLFGMPGAPHWDRRLGSEIFVRRKDYIRALLFVRENGAPYLRAIAIPELWSMVTTFVTDNFWYICGGQIPQRVDCSYADQISVGYKNSLADALAVSAMFEPRSELTLYPLLPIRVAANFESERFFLLNSADLSTTQLPQGIRASDLTPSEFPPLASWDGHKRSTITWLGVRSPLPLVSHKIASAILGAVALTPQPHLRHLFSGRTMFGGHCTIAESCSISCDDNPHTPPIMHDLILTEVDHGWLAILAALLDTGDQNSRSKLRALEYFYRAWFLDPRERFPALCMSLDSLVGASQKHTAAAVKYVKSMVDATIDDERLRLLLRVRGAVIHGAAPDVYDSEYYENYYVDYETDPIRDLELIVAKCLRTAIFGTTLKCHPDPNAKLLTEIRAKGRLPARLDEGCILPADV